MRPGPLIIVSGPSGSGKSTLIRRVLEGGAFPLRLAVSATTRERRPGEADGVDYWFWTRERFETELARGAFVEHALVHGNYYGTPRAEVDGHREKGTGVVLDIDVQGAGQVRPLYPEHVSVFIKLSRPEMYAERLRRRASETEGTIARRMETARRELGLIGEYQHVIVNDDDKLDDATARLRELIARQFNP
ncbi:MAG: guanylate kinase [Gemmataceae bacterium]